MFKKLYDRKELKKLLSIATGISFCLFTISVFLKFFELYSIRASLEQSLVPLFFKGILSDFSGISRILMVLFAFAFIIPNRLLGRLVSRFVILLLGLISLVLVVSTGLFFIEALVPLDHSVFSYSITEMMFTVKASDQGFFSYLMQAVLSILFIILALKSKFNGKTILITLAAVLLLGLGGHPLARSIMKQENHLLVKNSILSKSDYFILKSYKYLQRPAAKPIEKDETLLKAYLQYREADGFLKSAKQFDHAIEENLSEYPLLHPNIYNPLEAYFKPLSKQPNIVFLIVESLDARVFNDFNDKGVTIAPYLNSLREKSLYWDHFYSVAERTFGVLPAILGSLPMGEKGFAEKDPTPLHQSIVSILKKNRYQTNFFYGSWTSFHKMDNFLSFQKIDHLITSFPKEYEYKGDDFTWGIVDDLVFKRSMSVIDSINKYPMLNIYLTLSTHTPYKLPHKDQLLSEFKELNKGLDKSVLDPILSEPDKFLSVLYLDHSIKQLIADYKSKGLADNTIFIVTGDHCMHTIGKENELQNYGVPLFIYSDLIKRPQKFHNTSSHLDVSPSLIRLLESQKLIKETPEVHWLGLGLDTASIASRNTFIPFMNNNKDISACLLNNYFFTKGDLYEVGKNNHITPCDKQDVHDDLQERLRIYNYVNEYLVNKNRILPINRFVGDSKYELVEDYTENNFTLEANKDYHFTDIKLDKDYKRLLFKYTIDMSFKDSLDNPTFQIKIYNDKDEYVDYFHFFNSDLKDCKNQINRTHSVEVKRTIYNINLPILKKGNRIEFSIVLNKKEIEVKKLKMELIEY